MLVWVCALHCEAKPVIDFYRLKKSPDKTNFDLYRNSDMGCIVSGIGRNNMTLAISWANTQFNQNSNLCWINLGIAGHQNLAIGTGVLISTASQEESSETIYTQTKIRHPFESKPVISLTREKTDYDEVALFDMETYTFLQTTSKFTSLELCQSIKVISDNRDTPPTRNKAEISQLIADNMNEISEFANLLQNTEQQISK